jgi:hypothetical protein
MVATIMIVTRHLAYFLNSHAAWALPRIVHRLEAINGVGNELMNASESSLSTDTHIWLYLQFNPSSFPSLTYFS